MRRSIFIATFLLLVSLSKARLEVTDELIAYLTEYKIIQHLDSFQKNGVIHALDARMRTHVDSDRMGANGPINEDFTPPHIKRIQHNSKLENYDNPTGLSHNSYRKDLALGATKKELDQWWAFAKTVPDEYETEDSSENEMDDYSLGDIVKYFSRATRKVKVSKGRHKFELNMTVGGYFYVRNINTNKDLDKDYVENSKELTAFAYRVHISNYRIMDLIDMCITDQTSDGYGTTFMKEARKHIGAVENLNNSSEVDHFFLMNIYDKTADYHHGDRIVEKDLAKFDLEEEYKTIFGLILGEVTHIIESYQSEITEL